MRRFAFNASSTDSRCSRNKSIVVPFAHHMTACFSTTKAASAMAVPVVAAAAVAAAAAPAAAVAARPAPARWRPWAAEGVGVEGDRETFLLSKKG